MPLWHTEGGIYLQGSRSWLDTYRIPVSSPVTPSQGAASMVRAAVYFKASGVLRYFDFMVDASPAGRRVREDITSGFIDVTGIPGPGIAAHAAMVSFIEDATPLGFESKKIHEITVRTASFETQKMHIDVVWSTAPIKLDQVLSSDISVEIWDMMGNRVSQDDAEVGEFPLYVLRKFNDARAADWRFVYWSAMTNLNVARHGVTCNDWCRFPRLRTRFFLWAGGSMPRFKLNSDSCGLGPVYPDSGLGP